MEYMTKEEKKRSIQDIFDRKTIVEILPSKEAFIERLMGDEKMLFFIGFDATAPTLHLSHAKNIMLLEKFRCLGHKVVLLFGDFTAMIGDPTGESSKRKQLSREEVLENVEKWKKLIRPLMDFDAKENPPHIRYNSEWLAPLTFQEVIQLASHFTVGQMLERDMFEKRMKKGDPVYLHEFFYPLMQGYDSVALEADVELCGTDQTFNALSGRTLRKKIQNKEKFVVTVTLMEDPETGELMSKSKGTGVFLDTDARNMFGQVMSLGDGMTEPLLRHCTHLSLDEIDMIIKNENPRDTKLQVAQEIVALFYGRDEAEKEKKYFIETFSNKNIDADSLESIEVSSGEIFLDVLVREKLAESKGDARRKILQGGVSLSGEKIMQPEMCFSQEMDGKILRVGKKHFKKVVLKKREEGKVK